MSADVFEEIPMVIHNSHLIHAFLFEMREASSAADAEFELLSIDDHVATTKTFSLMCVLSLSRRAVAPFLFVSTGCCRFRFSPPAFLSCLIERVFV